MEGYIAEIRMFAGNFAPRGWAFCNGQILSIAQNTALFALIGTTYGGNGQTTFALPDLRGRTAISGGQGPGLPGYSLGQQGGQPEVTLIATQMPTHSHNVAAVGGGGSSAVPTNRFLAASTARDSIYSDGPASVLMNQQAVATAGGSQPHENMMPYTTVNYIICLEGIFPSRN